MSFQPGLGEVGLKGPYVALTPSPIIAISENGRKIAKHKEGSETSFTTLVVQLKFTIL